MASLYPVKGGYKICYLMNGRRRYTPVIRRRNVAQRKLDAIEQLAEQAKLGLVDPRADDFARAEAKPLAAHAEAFGKAIAAKGRTPAHVRQTKALVLDVIGVGHFVQISDLRLDEVQEAIDDFGRQGKRVKVRSLRRKNAAVTAMKAFSKWLRKSGRCAVHQLEDLESYNAATDPKRQRRPLIDEEVVSLLTSTAAGPARGGVTGPDRAMLYRTMLGSGLRKSEALSLEPEAFHLASTHPYITLEAKSAKNRRGTEQPISADLAAILRPWLKTKPAREKLWQFTPSAKPSIAFRADLKAAGVEHVDADGRYADLHALRHTYITWGLTRGVPLKVMQELARHSTPVLTAKYGHVGVVDVQAALGKLPGTQQAKPAEQKMGGGA